MNAAENAAPEAERRQRVLADLRALQRRARSNNQPLPYKEIRESYPELAGMLFSGRALKGVKFDGHDLQRLDFRGTDFSGSTFDGARILGARFEYAKVARDALKRAADWGPYRESWTAEIEKDAQKRPQEVYYNRRPGERFSVSPLLPELMILSPDEVQDKSRMADAHLEFLYHDRLAIAVTCLTDWEIRRVLVPDNYSESRDSPLLIKDVSAKAYCRTVTAHPQFFGLPKGTTMAYPNDTIYRAAHRGDVDKPTRPNASHATDLGLADIGFGRQGREFVQLFAEGGETRVVENDGVGAPGLAVKAEGRPAFFRPIFLLGERA